MNPTALLSAMLNAVQGINGFSSTQTFIAGNTTSPAYATSVVLSTSAGWIANIQVLAAGSGQGFIYNCPTFATAVNATKLMPIQTTVGSQKGWCNFNNGMVLIPGPGQLVSVTYSLQQQPVTT